MKLQCTPELEFVADDTCQRVTHAVKPMNELLWEWGSMLFHLLAEVKDYFCYTSQNFVRVDH